MMNEGECKKIVKKSLDLGIRHIGNYPPMQTLFKFSIIFFFQTPQSSMTMKSRSARLSVKVKFHAKIYLLRLNYGPISMG